MYALKYLYAFLEISEKNILELKENDLHQLSAFLKGFSSTGSDYEFNLLTKRSNKSLAIFFSAYKEYFKYLDVKDSPLLKDFKSSGLFPRNPFVGRKLIREVVPEYINEEEYARLMDLLSNEDDIITLRNKCMIRLMYESGLRLGELLGLTFEDIELRNSSNGNVSCVILVRNRLSNREYQQAKTCMKVYDKRSYNSNDYKTRNVGFQEAIVFDFDGISTYDLVCQYIDVAHENAENKEAKNYKTTVADAVGKFSVSKKTNRYLFLNTRGGLLSDEVWNQCLREIFTKANIQIDVGYRKHNLSHRFRHGFAMKLMYGIGNVSKSAVKTFTRHRSDEGLNAYNNPTTEDIVRMKEELVSEIGIVDLFERVKE
jgi:site-specific recombinase XerD